MEGSKQLGSPEGMQLAPLFMIQSRSLPHSLHLLVQENSSYLPKRGEVSTHKIWWQNRLVTSLHKGKQGTSTQTLGHMYPTGFNGTNFRHLFKVKNPKLGKALYARIASLACCFLYN